MSGTGEIEAAKMKRKALTLKINSEKQYNGRTFYPWRT
jgi:hypothetical protein